MPATVGFQNDNRSPIGATRESLWDVIVQIRKDETYIASTASTVTVKDQVHQWATKTARTRATNANVQGFDPTYDNTNTARSQNFTQIMDIAYQLTGTRRAVDAIGDPWAQERDEAMKDLKSDLEFALLRGSLQSGNNSTGPRMQGLRHFASTLATSQSGISLSEAQLNTYLGIAWDNGMEIDTLLVGRVLKSRISGFTAGNTKNVNAADYTLIPRVDVYESDFGVVKINKHRFATQSGDTNFDLIGYDSGYVRLGFLRTPEFVPLAKTGDADNEMIVAEATLQVDSELAVLYAQRHL